VKKKFSSKSLSSPKELNRYENDERLRNDENKKAISNTVQCCNVHTFCSSLGLVGDDVSYLEKLYLRIKSILEIYKEKLSAGYEVKAALLYSTIYYDATLLNSCMLNSTVQNIGDVS
jgi:hypothetical protein